MGIWDTAFAFLAVDTQLKELVLSFRGSETLTQLFEEIVHHSLVPWPGAPEAQVNEFFLQAVDDLLPQITKAGSRATHFPLSEGRFTSILTIDLQI